MYNTLKLGHTKNSPVYSLPKYTDSFTHKPIFPISNHLLREPCGVSVTKGSTINPEMALTKYGWEVSGFTSCIIRAPPPLITCNIILETELLGYMRIIIITTNFYSGNILEKIRTQWRKKGSYDYN